MSDILIGQSYFLRFDAKLWAAMQPYPPLGALYAASYVREHGHTVALFDAMLAASEDEWASALDREQPRVAVLYEDNFNYLSKMCLLRMREAAFTMIRMARDRGCTVVVAGSDATDHYDLYLDRGAGYVIRGEGEITLGEVLDALLNATHYDLSTINGLVFRSPDSGETVVTRPRIENRKLDELPFPAWDLVDVPHYRAIWLRRHGYYSMNMVTTRGCPFSCNWCAKPIWGQRYNSRSPENVAAEMRWLRDTYTPDHIWFADDIMGLTPRWLNRFADALDQVDVHLPFKSLHRVDLLLRDGTVEALQRAGARTVWVGAESGSQTILDAMQKGTRVEQIAEATRRLKAADIEVGFFLQFGYPGESRADIELTLQMVRDCEPDDIGMSVSYPLPGTPFFERVKQDLGAQTNWTDSADLAMMYRGPYSTAFYRRLHSVLHSEFRRRRHWAAIRGVAMHPTLMRPSHVRHLLAAARHAVALPLHRRALTRIERADAEPAALTLTASPPVSVRQ
jgi:anaerobic magnesium-protoporphyrin IX monomethyl ester cyclase